MNIINKYIAESESNQYYKSKIDKLTEEQRNKLEILLQKLEDSGAKKPLSWALSETTENIPQFARFLFLKGLADIVSDVEENMGLADDVDENYEGNIFDVSNKLKGTIGELELNNFLISYAKGIMWQVANLIDNGNYNEKGEPMWSLKEIGKSEDGNSERFISGLHENLNNFEEELIKLSK